MTYSSKDSSIVHEVHGPGILVAGNDAQKFAEVFHVETRRPMKDGVLNPEEAHSLAVVRSNVSRLLGKPGIEGQKVFFSVPAPTDAGDRCRAYHEASIRQILSELGYDATSIEEGLAVVFGVSCGSGLCNVCLAVLSVPVISFIVDKAGDFTDARAAVATGDLSTRTRSSRSSGSSSIG